jgi:serine/threonine-protein kinase
VGVAAEQDTNERTMVERRDPLLGAVFDRRFRVDAKLAAGGFGAIYCATHLKSGHEFALKVLHANLTHDPRVVARFRREGEALTRLRDPHTITAYELGEAPDGTLYIVMELLHGETLYERIRTSGPMAWRRAMQIARAVCSSLAEAHAHGIIHRDLKPTNIHLEPRGTQTDFVKVLDFGIAKLLQDSDFESSELTQAGQMIGTLDYMSPEQMVGGLCTATSDIYTLGIVMYEMIAGHKPFDDANSAAAALAAVLTTTPPPLSGHAAVPPEVEHVVMKCLERQYGERYQSALELAVALDDVLVRDDDLAISVARRREDDEPTSPLRVPVIAQLPPDPQRAPTVPLRPRPATPRPPESAGDPDAQGGRADQMPPGSRIAALASQLAGAASQIATVPRSSTIAQIAARAAAQAQNEPTSPSAAPVYIESEAQTAPQVQSARTAVPVLAAGSEESLPATGPVAAVSHPAAAAAPQHTASSPIVPRTRRIELPMPADAPSPQPSPPQRASAAGLGPAPQLDLTGPATPTAPTAPASNQAAKRAAAAQVEAGGKRASAPQIESDPQIVPQLVPWTPEVIAVAEIATEPHVAPVMTPAPRGASPHASAPPLNTPTTPTSMRAGAGAGATPSTAQPGLPPPTAVPGDQWGAPSGTAGRPAVQRPSAPPAPGSAPPASSTAPLDPWGMPSGTSGRLAAPRGSSPPAAGTAPPGSNAVPRGSAPPAAGTAPPGSNAIPPDQWGVQSGTAGRLAAQRPSSPASPGNPSAPNPGLPDQWGVQSGTAGRLAAQRQSSPPASSSNPSAPGSALPEPWGVQNGTAGRLAAQRPSAPPAGSASSGSTGHTPPSPHGSPTDQWGAQSGTNGRLAAPRPRNTGTTPLSGTPNRTLREAYPTIHQAPPSATRPPLPAFDDLPTTLVGTAAQLIQLAQAGHADNADNAEPVRRDPAARWLAVGIAIAIMLIAALIANWLTIAL